MQEPIDQPKKPILPPLFGQKAGTSTVRLIQQYGIVIAFVVLCVALSIASPFFLTTGNLLNVLRQTSINGILAIGMTFVILTRGIDLSVGSIVALAGVIGASFATNSMQMAVAGGPYHPALAIGVGVLAGMGCGFVSGVVVSRFAVPAFVATLGMLGVARGLTLLYTGGLPVPNLTPEFRWIGTGAVAGIPVPVIIFFLVFLGAWVVLAHTRYGRHVYAVGGNEKSAKTSGIDTKRVILSVYVISGALAALGGLILTARTGSGLTQAGMAYELDAIAAVVIGGTSLAGGVGSIVGTLFGALIIGVMTNGLQLLGVDAYYQQVIKGVIIVLAVMLDPSRRSRD